MVQEFPHDPQAFTQGLFFHEGFLYESTGLRGESTLRRVDLETGEVLEERRLFSQFFGEGAALAGDFIVQLTWKAGIGFVYTLDQFRLVREFRYSGEGWGLTFDGEHLVMSDGSDSLRFLDPDTLREVRTLKVTADGEPLPRLNELEWIDGEIWANIWMDQRIARIRPDTGEVTAFVDLTGIFPSFWRLQYPEMDVLNGIAWDPEGGRVFVTGQEVADALRNRADREVSVSFPKRHRIGFWVALGVLLLSIWPLYPWVAGVEPLVLGMPFSMFWLVLMIATVFFTFLTIFTKDRDDDEALDREYRD